MQTFKVRRKFDELVTLAKEQGWEVDTAEHDQGGDGIWLRDMEERLLQVRINTFSGRFVAYNPGGLAGTELSESLDGEPWYDGILHLIYVPEDGE